MQAVNTAEKSSSTRSKTVARSKRGDKQVPLGIRLWRYRWAYLLVLPGFLYFVIFHYVPLWGNIAAFQDFSPYRGYLGSPWIGLQNFADIATNPDIGYVIWNTLLLSLLQIVFAFPAAIVLALMLNSLLSERFKRFMQSVLYLPHFLGWVIIISIWQQFFGGDGLINQVLQALGMHTIDFITNSDLFRPMLVLQVIWKETGWSTIIFLAALSSIDMNLYEAAVIDGADGWRRMWHITLPGIRNVIVILFILRMGSILDTGFEQIFLQMQGVDIRVAQTIDIFAYIRGIQGGQWGLTTALGLVKAVVGTVLILCTNKVVKLFGEEGLF
ncbi:protein LplB [Reticulibacter mediterranei]|uniref:Protein LplB n=1 Tax=Reticulibacter mediterranei TaxID=2778369 RepID=A0A8J3IU91_9CHLR|nr:ABC transporter permease subunit [Reticulibacter mediterranei]GHO96867.1 protein LplB [Reticulibacter mediterranei]